MTAVIVVVTGFVVGSGLRVSVVMRGSGLVEVFGLMVVALSFVIAVCCESEWVMLLVRVMGSVVSFFCWALLLLLLSPALPGVVLAAVKVEV